MTPGIYRSPDRGQRRHGMTTQNTTAVNGGSNTTHTPGQQEGGTERPPLELLQGGANGGANPLFITTEDVERTEPREDWLIAIAEGHLAKHKATRVTPQMLLGTEAFKRFCVRKWTEEVAEFQRIEAGMAEAARMAALSEAQRQQEREARETEAELDRLLGLVPLSPEEAAAKLDEIREKLTGKQTAGPKPTEDQERETRKSVEALRPKLGNIVPNIAWESRFTALAARKVFIFKGIQVFGQELEKKNLLDTYRKNLERHLKQIEEVVEGLTEMLVTSGIPKPEIGKGEHRCDKETYAQVEKRIMRDSKWGKLLSQPSDTVLETDLIETKQVKDDPAAEAKKQAARSIFLPLIATVVTDAGQAESLTTKAVKAHQDGEEPTVTFKRLATNRQHEAVRTKEVQDGEVGKTAQVWMTLSGISEAELHAEVQARVVALRALAEQQRAAAPKPGDYVPPPKKDKGAKKGKGNKNADKKQK